VEDDVKAGLVVPIAKAQLRREQGKDPTTEEIEQLALQYMVWSDQKVRIEHEALSNATSARAERLVYYAQSHEGRISIADAIHTERLAEGEVLEALRSAPLDMKNISTLIRNPCHVCGSVRLDGEWVGTGYCSFKCCDHERQTGEGDAKQFAETVYQRWIKELE
jgi:hypothetical protein